MPSYTFADRTVFNYDGPRGEQLPQLECKTSKSKDTARRRKPDGVSMTPYHNISIVEEPLARSVPIIRREHQIRDAVGWFYTLTCDGTNHQGPEFLHKAKVHNSLGAGGYGKDYIYIEGHQEYVADTIAIYPGSPHLSGLPDRSTSKRVDIDDLVSQTQASVVEKTLGRYDALTELAEGKDTLKMVLGILKSCVNPLKSLRSLYAEIRKHGTKVPTDLALQYEYGVRPLIGSINQINDLLKKHDQLLEKFKSSRTQRVEFAPPDDADGSYCYRLGYENVRVRSSSVIYWDNKFDKVIDKIQLNPLQTAWELFPYSFVVDWFIDIGGWLSMQLAEANNRGATTLFCTSIRVEAQFNELYTREGQKFDPIVRTRHYDDFWSDNECFAPPGKTIKGSGRVQFDHSITLRGYEHPRQTVVYNTYTINTYNRFLFEPKDVPLQVNLNPLDLSLRRMLDGLLLILAQLKR